LVAYFFDIGFIWSKYRYSIHENLRLRFSMDGKHFENGAFRKWWRHDDHLICLSTFSWSTNPKLPVIVAFSNFSGVVWTENTWCVFRMKTRFSNFSGVVWTGPQPSVTNSESFVSILRFNVETWQTFNFNVFFFLSFELA